MYNEDNKLYLHVDSRYKECRKVIEDNRKGSENKWLDRFWNYTYDFRPNCTPLSSITKESSNVSYKQLIMLISNGTDIS